MSISQILLPEFDQEMAVTRRQLEAVPDGNLAWKPHEKSMTMLRLAGHIAEIPSYAVAVINTPMLDIGGGSGPEQPKTKQAILEAFDKNVGEAKAAIAGATDDHMGQKWQLVFKGATVLNLPRAAAVRAMSLNHIIHHRGQLSVYLRLNNIPVPGIYGPSADFPL